MGQCHHQKHNLMNRLFILFLLLVSSTAHAQSCTKTGTVCVDTTPSKVISAGYTVTLAQIGGCWQYQDTYTCIQPDAVNYCQPFINAAPACWQTSSVCAQMDTLLGTGCMQYTQTYQCGSAAMPTAPANTTQLSDTYTLVSSNYNTAACAADNSNTNCYLASNICSSTTPATPLPPGISSSSVAPDGCYQQTNTYACLDGNTTTDCGQYSSNPNCTLQTSSNVNTLSNGTPLVTQQTYSCLTTPASSTTTTNCSGTTFCQGGSCFNTGSPPDAGFATTAALMEAGRQGGVYNQNGVIFSGVDDSCRIRLFGLSNCCATKSGSGSSFSNQSVMGSVLQIGGETLQTGSKYVYDALFTDAPSFLQQGMLSFIGAPTFSSTSPSFGLYGMNISYTGFTTGANALASQTSIAQATAQAAATADAQVATLTTQYDSLNAAALNAAATAPGSAAATAAQNAANAAQSQLAAAQATANTANAAAVTAQGNLLSAQADTLAAEADRLSAIADTTGAPADIAAANTAIDNSNTAADSCNAYYNLESDATTSAAGEATAAGTSSVFSSLSTAYQAANVTETFGSFTFTFNYYQLAAELAITVYEDLTACNTNEQMLGMKRGQNLCTYVGTYCSTSIPLVVGSLCVENTQTYCCYNSLLAQIINEQGRVQIGKGYGSTSSPDCSGFSIDQFAQIDFSKIDLSAFTAQIMATIVPPQQGGITSNAAATVKQQIQSYFGQ
jgi:conjugal transfer mating pair stabilization protein TraN